MRALTAGLLGPEAFQPGAALRRTLDLRLPGNDSITTYAAARSGGETGVTKICGFAGSFVCSSVGWWLGAFVGTMTAFILSTIGLGVGIYVGRRIAAEFV